MKKNLIKIVGIGTLTICLAVVISLWHASPTHAIFVANDVIDDNVFDNATTMTATQIDNWLNTNFPSSCISTNNNFSAPDPTGYSPNPSSQFFYSSTPVSAGKVIYDAAQAYGINPQVLLATLQKEETLVDGSIGCATWQYTSAVGYGCTDSGTNTHDYSYPSGGLLTPLYYINGSPVNSVTGSCVNSGAKAGFSEQVIHAAWLMTFGRHKSEGDTSWAVIKGNWNNCDDNNTCPSNWNIPASFACYGGFMTQGTFKRCPTDTSAIYYDGYATIDSTSVHMDNGATASFYWYTPHLHGNQSFVNIFESWFGPTKGSLVQAYGDKTVYLLSGTSAYPIYDVNVLNDLAVLGPVRQTSASEINNYSLGTVVNRLFKSSAGSVYLVNASIKLAFPDCNMVTDYGYSCAAAIQLPDDQLAKFVTGPPVTHLLKAVSSPAVYFVIGGAKRQIPSWSDAQAYKIAIMNTLTDAYVNQMPASSAIAYGPGSLVKTLNSSSVYVVQDLTNVLPLSSFLYSQEVGLGASPRTIISYYSVSPNNFGTKFQCGGNNYIGTHGTAYLIPSASIMTAYGFQQSDFQDGGAFCMNLPISSQALDHFIRLDNGAIFYISGGQKQLISTYAVYQAHGGTSANTIQASSYLANMLADGSMITN